MATHGLIVHPHEPTYLTCRFHVKRGSHLKWPSAEILENHFDEEHRKRYAHWRCNHASEPPMLEMDEIHSEERCEGVWNGTGDVFVDVPALQSDVMAMPSVSMTSSSLSSQTGALSSSTPCPDVAVDAPPVWKFSLGEWMRMYAEFQHLSAKCVDPSVDPSVVEKIVKQSHNHLCTLDLTAPHDDLLYCRTSRGATWPQVFRELSRFFAAVCTCSLTLNSSGTILYCLLHVMSQLIKQLLTWYLTHDMQLRDVTALRA